MSEFYECPACNEPVYYDTEVCWDCGYCTIACCNCGEDEEWEIWAWENELDEWDDDDIDPDEEFDDALDDDEMEAEGIKK